MKKTDAIKRLIGLCALIKLEGYAEVLTDLQPSRQVIPYELRSTVERLQKPVIDWIPTDHQLIGELPETDHQLTNATRTAEVYRLYRELSKAANKLGELDDEDLAIELAKTPPKPIQRNRRRLIDLYNDHTLKLEHLVEGLIPAHGLTVLSGAPSTGKSYLCLHLAIAVAGGSPCWLDQAVKHGAVHWIDAEGCPATMRERSRKVCKYDDPDWIDNALGRITADHDMPYDLTRLEWLTELEQAIRETGAILVVIDSLSRTSTAKENDAGEMSKLLDPIDAIGKRYKTCILMTHHATKENPSGYRGSSAIMAVAQALLTLEVIDGRDKTMLKLTTLKSRHGETQVVGVKTIFSDGGYTADYEPIQDRNDNLLGVVKCLLNNHDQATTNDLVEKTGISISTIRRIVKSEIFVKQEQPGKATLYSLTDEGKKRYQSLIV